MSPAISRVDSIVQFTEGSASNWVDPGVALPAGAIAIDTVNKIIKEGDGSTLFNALPVCLDYNFSGATSEAQALNGGHVGGFAVAKSSAYAVDPTKVADILARLSAFQTQEGLDNTTITGQQGSIVVGPVTGGDEGAVVTCQSSKYAPGAKTIAQMISDIVDGAEFVSQSAHVSDIIWYTDAGLTQKAADQQVLSENQKYWGKIDAYHDSTELRAVDFGLGTITSGIDIISSGGTTPTQLLTAVYSGSGTEVLDGTIVDASGNIYAIGHTDTEGAGSRDGLILKFDSNLNILARKVYGGAGDGKLYNAVIDSAGNIFVCGYTDTIGQGAFEALIVKFDSNLSVLASKVYGGSAGDIFYNLAIDTGDNVVCVGLTNSEGAGVQDMLIVRFDNSLTILTAKAYGGTGNDTLTDVVIDGNDNIYTAGHTGSEGVGGYDGMVIKFDTSLNILIQKTYGGSVTDYFTGIALDSAGNIFCAGYTYSTVNGVLNALIVKFNPSIVVEAAKVYGGDNDEFVRKIVVDSNDDVIAVGCTNSEGAGSYDALLIKFDNDLNKLSAKAYGTIGSDIDYNITVDSNNDIIIVGSAEIAGNTEAVVTKLPGTLPKGIYTNKRLTTLILSDSNLPLIEAGLALNTTPLASMIASMLTLADASTLSLIDGTGSVVTDTTIMDAVSNVFEVTVGNLISGAGANVPVTFNVTTDDGDENAAKTVDIEVKNADMLVSVYGGSNIEVFSGIATDSADNIVCVGYTYSEGAGIRDGLIIKYDSSLNILARKTYGGATDDAFTKVAIDSNDNIFTIGVTDSEGPNSPAYHSFIIIKFDSDLNKLAGKVYGGNNTDSGLAITIDSNDNVICTGYTYSEGINVPTYYNALVIKFDNNLSILARKIYNGSDGERFYSVAVDSADNVICVGFGKTDAGAGNIQALVVKMDTDLNKIIGKVYGSSGDDRFYGVIVDSSDNIICAGITNSEGSGNWDTLVVKFDSDLNILAGKVYGGSGVDSLNGLTVDADDNVIVVGYTGSEGPGGYSGINVRLTPDLNTVIDSKLLGGTGSDKYTGVAVDSTGNIIVVGKVDSEGQGGDDAVIVKFTPVVPTGTFIPSVLTGLTMEDVTLTLVTSTMVLSDSNLPLNESTMTLSNSALTLADSNLTQESDILG